MGIIYYDVQQVKNVLAQHLQSQVNLGFSSRDYYVNGLKMCVGAMAHLTEISPYILNTVLKQFAKGHKFFRHGNSGTVKSLTCPTLNFICWLKKFREVFYKMFWVIFV